MKQLLLVRHAKSDWNTNAETDFDRPLNKRGHKDAPVMAERLLEKHIVPQHIVSSPALRAITTAKYFAELYNIDEKLIQLEPSIYEAPVSNLLSVINKLDNKYNFVALFGHNPGITGLAVKLSDSSVYDLPTCGVVLIEFPFDDWAMISENTGEQKLYDYPKSEDN